MRNSPHAYIALLFQVSTINSRFRVLVELAGTQTTKIKRQSERVGEESGWVGEESGWVGEERGRETDTDRVID